MSRSYVANRAKLCDEICARLAAGETVRDICRDAHMPGTVLVWKWMHADPAFGEAVRRARALSRYRRDLAFDDARAKVLLARMTAGEGLHSVFAAPALVTRRTYNHWLATQGEFAEAVGRIKAFHAERRRAQSRARRWTFDEAVAEAVIVAVAQGASLHACQDRDPSLPCYDIIRRWRAEQPEFDASLRHAAALRDRARRRRTRLANCTPRLMDEICEHIAAGETLRDVGRRPEFPSAGTLYRWVAQRRDFAEAVAQACQWRAEILDDEIMAALEARRPRTKAGLRAVLAPFGERRRRETSVPGRRWR